MQGRFVARCLAVAVMAIGAPALADVKVYERDGAEATLGAMMQVIGYGQMVKDPFANDERVYLFMRTARFRFSGSRDRLTLNLETALGPEDRIVAPNPGIALGLLDLNADVRLTRNGGTYLKIGQFKVPYGREQLTYSGDLLFADRSVENLGFVVGRDVGVAAVSDLGLLKVVGGVFTGGGRDVPLRFIPEKVGMPLVVARVGVGNIDEDPFYAKTGARGAEGLEWGVFANGLFTRDSLIGHSSVLNVKTADKSLLLNSNWNPYIGQRPLDQGKWYQAGMDAIVRAPMGAFTLAGELQADYASFSNRHGDASLSGGRAQVSVARGALDVAVRYGMLRTDAAFAAGETAITGGATIQEITPTVGLRIGQNMRLVADLPVLLDTPVVLEDQIGSYIATDMPDQTSLLTRGATVSNQNVVQGRLMFQAQF
jgi:hypothetical protein